MCLPCATAFFAIREFIPGREIFRKRRRIPFPEACGGRGRGERENEEKNAPVDCFFSLSLPPLSFMQRHARGDEKVQSKTTNCQRSKSVTIFVDSDLTNASTFIAMHRSNKNNSPFLHLSPWAAVRWWK